MDWPTVIMFMLISTVMAQENFDFSQPQYSPAGLPADILTLLGRSLQPVDAQPWPQLQTTAGQGQSDVPLAGVLRNLLTPQQSTPPSSGPSHLQLEPVRRTQPSAFLGDSGRLQSNNFASLLQLLNPPQQITPVVSQPWTPPRLTDEEIMAQGLDIVTRGLLGGGTQNQQGVQQSESSGGVVSTLLEMYNEEQKRQAAEATRATIPPQLISPVTATTPFGNPADLLARFTPDQRQLLQNLRHADQMEAVSSNSIETRHLRNNQILRELRQRSSRTPIAFGGVAPPTASHPRLSPTRLPTPAPTPPPDVLGPKLQNAFVEAAAPAIGDFLNALTSSNRPHTAESISNLREAHLTGNQWKQILEPYLVETRPTVAKRFAREQRRSEVKRDFEKKYARPVSNVGIVTAGSQDGSLFRNPVRPQNAVSQQAPIEYREYRQYPDYQETNEIQPVSSATENPLVKTGLQFVANLFKNGPTDESQGLYWGDGDVKLVNEKGKRVLGQMAGYENGGFVLPINTLFPRDNNPLKRQFQRS